MLQTLLLQGFSDGSDVLQSFQKLNAGLSTLQQQHTLPVGLLLLHQHLQEGEENDEEEEDNRKREKVEKRRKREGRIDERRKSEILHFNYQHIIPVCPSHTVCFNPAGFSLFRSVNIRFRTYH